MTRGDGDPLLPGAGWADDDVWRCEVTETVTRVFYVRAGTKAEAREAAEALSSGVPIEDDDDDIDVGRWQSAIPEGAWVWAGGEHGDWEHDQSDEHERDE